MKKLMILMLLLSACGKKIEGVIDPTFTSYVQDFEMKIGVEVNGVSIRFKPQTYPVLGVCKSGGEIAEVEIDPTQWEKMNDIGREQLIYHELGHCALGRPHDGRKTKLNNVTVEGNIMYPYFFGEDWNYIRYREQYKVALKNNDIVKE